MVTLLDIRSAAFWDRWICLDCGAAEEVDIPEGLEITGRCECGGTIRNAATVLEIWEKIDEG